MAILPQLGSLPLLGGGPFAAPAFPDEGVRMPPATAAVAHRAALEALYPTLAHGVHRFLCDLLGDATLAMDATQETFVRSFRRVGELPSDARLAPWVFGVARRVSLEVRKARGRARRVMVDSPTGDPPDVADHAARSPEAELLDREALRVVTVALDRLSDDRRAVLLLRLDHSLSYEDISAAMGWSLAKVKVELFRAREVLRATLDAYRGGEP